MMERFNALLLREWMQHKRGWLITLFALPALFLLVLPFGDMQVDLEQPLPVAAFATMFTALGMMGIALAVTAFQWPSLARRDVQDRSIEFWLSLPGTHVQSIGATLLSHGLLLPMAGLVLGYGLGLVMSVAVLLKLFGIAGLGALSWPALLATTLPMLAGALAGLVLMMLWLSPIVLAVMAASAWLKRWGLPALCLTVFGLGLYLDKAWGNRVVFDVVKAQVEGAGAAFAGANPAFESTIKQMVQTGEAPQHLASLIWQDTLMALQQLATPQFAGGLAVAGLCFWLLVLRRSRA